MVNGQWSMVNACTPQREPILFTGVKQKTTLHTGLDKLPLHLAKIMQNFKECSALLVEFRLLQP